jgi:hypothetical protein
MRQHSSADQRTKSRRRGIGFLVAILSVCLVALALIVNGQKRKSDTVGQAQSGQSAPGTNFPEPAPNSGPALSSAGTEPLSADFSQFSRSVPGIVGLAAVAVGGDGTVLSLGGWDSGPAWSTAKVPLVLAKMQEDQFSTITAAMRAAITASDNDSAKEIWASMGTPQEAALKMERVLRAVGDPTIVEYRAMRAAEGYTAFGQTTWSLADQAKFMSGIACDPGAVPLLELMGQVDPDQRWGLGQIPDTRFKGGWGPSLSGQYLVRQVGLVPTPNGTVAVAVAAEPNVGLGPEGLSNGEQALDALANWIAAHLGDLPAGHCS